MTRVLVTGGAGYIGAHTCKALARAGYQPIVYDNLRMGHRHNVKWGPLVVGDLGDREKLGATLRHYRPQAVLHFAGCGYVGESFTNPAKYIHNNAGNTLLLLDAMRVAGMSQLVFSSTCATYGVPETLPIPVWHAQRPINPYGMSKLVAEQMINEYARGYGLRYSILRYFNAAGADPEGELREEHDPESHLIPLVVGAASGACGPVSIFGTDYPTSDGTCIRDYIHVTDLANAHAAALNRLEKGAKSEVRNLGTGHGVSVRQVIHAVEHLTGRQVPYVELGRRPGDPAELVAAPDEDALQFTDIEEIIATVL